jgi:polysaccharide biosynthesis/export protein
MQSTQGCSPWRSQFAVPALLLIIGMALGPGCAAHKPHVDVALRREGGGGERNEGVPALYVVQFPDVLEVYIPGKTVGPVRCAVSLDGRLDLASVDYARVEGQTLPEIQRNLGELSEVQPDKVEVRVAEFRSQHIYVWGPGIGLQRAVPYQGPETVLDLLQRIGGIKPGAAPSDVHVIRAGVVENRPPEVYRVDLKAVVLKQDQRTNIRLQPFDQIYVGETQVSCLQRCLPLWLRPVYNKLCGLHRPAADGPELPKANSSDVRAAD